MINQILLVGRLGKDPELTAAGQHQKAQLSMATSESFRDRDGNWQERTEWHNFALWDKVAEYAVKWAKKGDTVMVQGSMTTRSWEGQNGKKYSYEIRVDTFKVLTPKKDPNAAGAPPASRAATPAAAATPGRPQGGPGLAPEDDLPF